MEKISDKLQAIVLLLDKDDFKKVSASISTHKNKKLSKLLKIMQESLVKEISKQAAFKKLYGKDYQKESDFLIRNECRLLYNIIKNYFINCEIESDLKNDKLLAEYYFLKAIHQKKDSTLFTKEFYTVLEQCKTVHDYIKALQLCDLHFTVMGAQQIQNPQNLKLANDILQEQQQILGQLYTAKSHVANFRFSTLFAMASKKDRIKLNIKQGTSIHYDEQLFSNDLISYYRLISETVIEENIKRKIELFEQALARIEMLAALNSEFLKAKYFCIVNIASLYYIQQEFEKAEGLFASIYTSSPAQNDHLITSIINYGNCLLQLGKYSEVLAVLEKYKTVLDHNQRIILYIDALYCNVYTMTENATKLRKQIPPNFQDLPDYFVFHYRFCLSILFFLENDFDSAIRESRNLCETLAYNKAFDEHLLLAKLMHKFFDKYNKRHTLDFKKIVKQLLRELDSFEAGCSFNFRIFIPSQWLRKRLEASI